MPGAAFDLPVVWYEGAGTSDKRYLVQDERGSVIAVDASSGVSIYSYDEYGAPNAWSGPSSAPRFRYAGAIMLAQAQLYSMRARVYSPSIGRFLQTDPILTEGGVNLYAYVGNDPVNGVDQSGLSGKDCHTGTLFCNGYIPIGSFSCSGEGCTDAAHDGGPSVVVGEGSDGGGIWSWLVGRLAEEIVRLRLQLSGNYVVLGEQVIVRFADCTTIIICPERRYDYLVGPVGGGLLIGIEVKGTFSPTGTIRPNNAQVRFDAQVLRGRSALVMNRPELADQSITDLVYFGVAFNSSRVDFSLVTRAFSRYGVNFR